MLPKNGSCKQWTYHGAGICISSQCMKWADDQRQTLLQQQKEQEEAARLRQVAEKTWDDGNLTKEQEPKEQERKEDEFPEKDKDAGGEGSQAQVAPVAAVQAEA